MRKHRLLAVFAHPDDETTVGPLLARYAREGHEIFLISATSGQKGVRPHMGLPAGEELGRRREDELRCAARQLGIHEPFLLGYQDQGIAAQPVLEEITACVRRLVDETRPEVLITWGPDGLTGHQDHRVMGNVATLVFQQQALLAHQPQKLYYTAFPESLFHAAPDPLRRNRPFYMVSDRFITTEVDCQEDLEAGLRAIDCHQTQFSPQRMEQIKEMYRRTLKGRVYLRLALATVPFPRQRERGLFEGLADGAEPAAMLG